MAELIFKTAEAAVEYRAEQARLEAKYADDLVAWAEGAAERESQAGER